MLLVMLLLLGVAMLAPSITYATPNQNVSDNFTNTTNVSELSENNTNSTIIQNTTTKVVNDSNTTQKLNQTAESSNNTNNSSIDYSNQTDTIQNHTAAASDGYQNVHGLWISADEASSVNLDELLKAGITDIFVKANRFSSPNYQSVLTSIINKFQGTGIRVHAWVTCFLDDQGKWVDPLGKNYTYTVNVPYTETVKIATKTWYKDWYKAWYKAWYKSWYKYRGSWKYTWKSYWTYNWAYNWKYYTSYTYETRTSYKLETRTGTDKTFNDALVSYIADLAKNYNIAGVHLDYVRYPGTAYLHPGGEDAITNFVKKVDETLFSIKPKLALSAALMPECSVNGYYYGQDYAKLSTYLDFLVPMIYKGNYNEDTSWIGTTTKWISNHSTKPVVAGLQVYASDSNVKKLSATEVIQDIKSAISNGSSGYVLFRYGLVDKAFFNQTSTIPSTNNNSTTTNNTTNTNTKTQTTFTIAQIVDAAGRVKAYVETNHALPNYVTIGSLQITMPQFLRLLTTSTLQVNSKISTPVVLKSASTASNPSEEMTSGNLDKNGYIDLATRIKSFMGSNGVAPNYGSTTLGKIRYESLIYLYSRVLAFYGSQQYLPNYAVMKPWSSVTGSSSTTTTVDPTIPSSMQVYLQATANCQVNDPRIIAMAQSITSGATSSYDKAQSIFNWVRDNLEYSMYYDSQKGAVNALSSRSANCCDHSHLIVALSRAAGLPARYVHGVCTFSSGTYGHVWAQIYANGQWYNADATSYRNELGVIRNWNTNSWTYKGTYTELPF